MPVQTFESSPPASPMQEPATPTSSIDGPASPVDDDFEHNLPTQLLDNQAEGPASPFGSEGLASPGGIDKPASPVGSEGPASPVGSDGLASPTGSIDEPLEAVDQHESVQENLQEYETYSPPASPTDSIYSQGHESEKHGSPHSRSGSPASLRNEGQNISPPGSPSPNSPVQDQPSSLAGVRSRSLSPVDDNADDVLTTGRWASVEDRSGGGSPRSRSASGSPARSGSPAGSLPRSRSGSRSRSLSPVQAEEIRSRSPSVSGRSRSVSPAAAGSRSPSHSPNVRSRSSSGSPGGRSAGSPRSDGSPAGSRSRSVSPVLRHSPPRSRSPSASPTSVNSPGHVQATAG